jgi:hypothetical protein
VVVAVTDRVDTVNAALLDPAATVTLAGTVAADVLLLESVTAAPPEGAGPLRVTVPCEETPPTTVVGSSETAESAACADADGGFTVIEENWNAVSMAAES